MTQSPNSAPMITAPDTIKQTRRGPVTIRRTTEADATALRAIRLEALRTHPESFLTSFEEDEKRPPQDWVDLARRCGGDGPEALFIAESGNRFVAMTGIFRNTQARQQHSATIWGVYVDPLWRGCGIAKELVTRCVDWARAQEVKLVRLTVVTTNASAIRCYESCGFQRTGTLVAAIFQGGSYYDEYNMIRWLKNPEIL